MEYEAIEGISSEQYESARDLIVKVHQRAVDSLGFYFGVDKIEPVKIELAPLLSSGGISRDRQGNIIMIINADRTDIGDMKTPRDYERWAEESSYTSGHETGHILHCIVNPLVWEINSYDDSPRTNRIRCLGDIIAELFAVLNADLTGFFTNERRKSLPHDWALELYKKIANECGTAAGLFIGGLARTPLDYAIKKVLEIKTVLDSYM